MRLKFHKTTTDTRFFIIIENGKYILVEHKNKSVNDLGVFNTSKDAQEALKKLQEMVKE